MKKFFMLLALIIAVNFSVTNAAQVSPVTDKAGLLTEAEINSLNERIRNVQHTHKIKIGIVFANSIGGRDIVKASDDILRQNFANSSNGSTVLLVDMERRKYEIATDSRMSEKITDMYGVPFLKNKFQSSLSNGDYAGACNNFIDGVDELMTFYKTNGKPYSDSHEGFDQMAAIGSVMLALFCGVMFRSMLINSMSNVRHAMTASDYLEKNSVKITENRDTFLFRNVKHYPRGNGGSGHGRSGGGSSGGGGGGSF